MGDSPTIARCATRVGSGLVGAKLRIPGGQPKKKNEINQIKAFVDQRASKRASGNWQRLLVQQNYQIVFGPLQPSTRLIGFLVAEGQIGLHTDAYNLGYKENELKDYCL